MLLSWHCAVRSSTLDGPDTLVWLAFHFMFGRLCRYDEHLREIFQGARGEQTQKIAFLLSTVIALYVVKFKTPACPWQRCVLALPVRRTVARIRGFGAAVIIGARLFSGFFAIAGGGFRCAAAGSRVRLPLWATTTMPTEKLCRGGCVFESSCGMVLPATWQVPVGRVL